MLIIPSVDVRAGRLASGASARDLVARYVAEGAEELHMVDLDAADRGVGANFALLADLARTTPVRARLAGGLSSVEAAREALDAGFAGVLFSSAVFGDDMVLRQVAKLGRRAIVEIEARGGWLSPRGGDRELVEVARGRGVLAAARAALDAGIGDLYVIDLGSEGGRGGPALGLLDEVRTALGSAGRVVRLHTGGGIRSLDDVRALALWGAASAVIGRALAERRFTVGDAILAAAEMRPGPRGTVREA